MPRKMKYSIGLLFIQMLLFSCSGRQQAAPTDPAADKSVLMQADRDFSALSEQKGMKDAFVEYLDSNGVLLRPDEMPVAEASAVDYIIRQDDSGFKISWKPLDAAIAASGDLGFTYGLYAIRPENQDTVFYGTYVNVWKKQQDGKWKFVLNSGNQGVGR